MMVLLNLIFWAVTMISNLLSRLILTLIAYLLVLVIQAFKVPGEAIKGMLEQLSDAIKSLAEYLLDLVLEVISNLISSLFDLVTGGISSSVVATGSVIGGLVEQTRNSIDGLLADFPQVLEGFSGMVSTIITDLWNNYKDAIGFVAENA